MSKPRWPSDERTFEELKEIRKKVSDGDTRGAVYDANAWLLLAVKNSRPIFGDLAGITDAELAARLAALAARWHQQTVQRPEGLRGKPAPAHLLAVFDQVFTGAAPVVAETMRGMT